MRLFMAGLSMLFVLVPAVANAETPVSPQDAAGAGGVSAVWVLANISYVGMRAQASASRGWRIIAFICGFPGTLVSLLAVVEGGERAYGVDIPRRRR